ncbi:serine phosphatase RsbU, regulator of sigma subunit [Longilinea arvoryzae]|uniref:Serine phosphatase RsbU, regulator of sigma subunit n=1 Tax=Longilinea arvoryzae TaxID=360412 RepID=A0A0S7BP07_9CHLR|nr:GAF domain-containing SpoIIE family protein phosphatase [Longilinea arvoryzae]GAP15665.1 serine phosphatase RsbU, regulator of sigma subunit [Longilinea arvoryzae]
MPRKKTTSPDPSKIHTDRAPIQDTIHQFMEAESLDDWKLAVRMYAQVVKRRSAELALINSVQEGLSCQCDMESIYNMVGDILRDTFNAQVVMISQYDAQTGRIHHHYAIERGQHLEIPGWQPIDSSRSAIARTHKPLILNYGDLQALVDAGKMHVVPGTEMPKTWLGVPMLVSEEVRGIVSLQNLDIENAFSQSDIDLLTALTNSMSISLENARLFNETQRLLKLLEDEVEIARQTQQSILPARLPSAPGYDFGALMIPARTVCGDFYDFIPLDNHRLCVVIGDVSDKGLPAALFMALTFSLVRAETGKNQNQHAILRNVNRYLRNMNAGGMFVTLLYCVLNFQSGLLEYSRAGHFPPIVLDPGGEFIALPVQNGQSLGIFEEIQIDQQMVQLPEGGLALLYSDGLTEALNPDGQEFGLAAVKQSLISSRRERGNVICERLWNAVQAHSGEKPHQDDFTTIVIKRE